MTSEPTLFGPARSGSLVGALGLGSVLGLAILTGCSVPAPPAPSNGSQAVSRGEPPRSAPGSSTASVSGSDDMDGDAETAGWKTFSTQGLSFKHPADWEIKAHPCLGCRQSEDRRTRWVIHIPGGRTIAQLRVDQQDDTERHKGLHSRTILERTPTESGFSKPAEVVFEHMAIDVTGKEQRQKVLLMLNDTASTNRRHERPMRSVFYPRGDFTTSLTSTDDFPKILGYDEDHVSIEDARKIMRSNEYRQLRTLMLGVRAEK